MTDLSANILPPCKDFSPLFSPLWFCFSHVFPLIDLFPPCTSKKKNSATFQFQFYTVLGDFFVFGLIIILENVCI